MKRIIPVQMSSSEFINTLVNQHIVSQEEMDYIHIDNSYRDPSKKPERSNAQWSFDEDYRLIKHLTNLKTPEFIGKLFKRTKVAIESRMMFLLGTSKWIRIVCLSDGEKESLRCFFHDCMLHHTPYENRVNILETVELYHFLQNCNLNDEYIRCRR